MKRNKGFFYLFILFLALPWESEAQMSVYQSRRAVVTDQGMGLLAKSPTRTIIDLNGSWHYRAPEDEDWKRVSVPSSFSTGEPLIFTREFNIDPSLFQRSVFQLVAVSVSYYCEIRINGQFVGKHAGLTSFSFKISSGVLKPGRNRITIESNAILNAQETVPLREQLRSARNYGGIVGDIALVGHDGVWVQETVIHASVAGEGKAATIQYQVLLNSGDPPPRAKDSAVSRLPVKRPIDHYMEVYDGSTGELVARSETRRVDMDPDRLVPVDLSVTIPSVRLWSPETPYLYVIHQKTLENGALLDESYTQMGFRMFSARGSTFMLNGSPFVMKGITYIEDSPFHGRSLTMEEYERDILLMKNLGANTIRLPYGATHPQLLNLCDRYGLIVLYDLSIQGAPASILQRPSFVSSARNILKESMARDINHPSIVAWGCAGGIDGIAGPFDPFLQELRKLIRASKHATYASFSTPADAALIGSSDFFAIDLYEASRDGLERLSDELPEKYPDKPIVISALSYPVEAGNYNGYSDPRSIDAQAQFFHEAYQIATAKRLAGIVIHTFSDYAVSAPLMSTDPVQQFTATLGVVDRYRLKRLAYDVLKARFNREKPPVLVVGSYAETQPSTFVIAGLAIILLFAIVYNLFRRFRENVVRAFLRPHNFFTDVRDQRMLSIFQTSMVGILGTFAAGLLVANVMYFWRTNVFFDILVYQFFPATFLKQWLNFIAWNPLVNLLTFAAGAFVLLLLYAVFLRTAAFFLKRNVLMFDAFSISMWSVLPVIMLAPVGMILHRIMDIPLFEITAAVLVVVFLAWTISRLLKGTAVVLDIRPLYFYLAGYALIFLALSAWLYSLDQQAALFGYLRHYFNVWSFSASLSS